VVDLTVAEILERAADLIEPEGAWTQHASARDWRGAWVGVNDPGAVCFCAIGAIHRATSKENEVREAVLSLGKVIRSHSIQNYNDAYSRTQDEVVAKLREAAAKARGYAC